MRWLLPCAVAVIVCNATTIASPAWATSPVPVVMGTSWDGPGHSLQGVVDTYIGTPGAVNVLTDYIGAHPGDPDPWFWVGDHFPALMLTAIAGNANHNDLGWYKETFAPPVIDGVDDGLVFAGGTSVGTHSLISFPSGTTKFGFYLDTHVDVGTTTGKHDQIFFTNRFDNDLGPYGNGAVHAPADGDVQCLVFDVSRWKGANTWLVCFEDLDSGLPVGPCCNGTDDDYNDLVFEVTANGATATRAITFGALKAAYR